MVPSHSAEDIPNEELQQYFLNAGDSSALDGTTTTLAAHNLGLINLGDLFGATDSTINKDTITHLTTQVAANADLITTGEQAAVAVKDLPTRRISAVES